MVLERAIWRVGIYWENEQNVMHKTSFLKFQRCKGEAGKIYKIQ